MGHFRLGKAPKAVSECLWRGETMKSPSWVVRGVLSAQARHPRWTMEHLQFGKSTRGGHWGAFSLGKGIRGGLWSISSSGRAHGVATGAPSVWEKAQGVDYGASPVREEHPGWPLGRLLFGKRHKGWTMEHLQFGRAHGVVYEGFWLEKGTRGSYWGPSVWEKAHEVDYGASPVREEHPGWTGEHLQLRKRKVRK